MLLVEPLQASASATTVKDHVAPRLLQTREDVEQHEMPCLRQLSDPNHALCPGGNLVPNAPHRQRTTTAKIPTLSAAIVTAVGNAKDAAVPTPSVCPQLL